MNGEQYGNVNAAGASDNFNIWTYVVRVLWRLEGEYLRFIPGSWPPNSSTVSKALEDLHQQVRDDPNSWWRVLNSDESLVYSYEVESKQQHAHCLTFTGLRTMNSFWVDTNDLNCGAMVTGCFIMTTHLCFSRTNTIIAPHCDSFLFPNIMFKLKGRHFDKVEEIQHELQMVFDALREQNDFEGAGTVFLVIGSVSELSDCIYTAESSPNSLN